ncbi:MAG: cytochrome c biogenesis protein CcsA [Deltaproteobacteria bacterium]|nr:cytochrome c biogenesis protein CcsA [Deltaproteobacteria bacterium]
MNPAALALAQIGAYGLASGLYLGLFLGGGPRLAVWGRYIFLLGFAAHLADIGIGCFDARHPLSSTSEVLSFVGWLLASGFLLASVRNRLATTGAFAAPTVLVFVLLARVLPDAGVRVGGGGLATLHILLSATGEALFALAAVLSLLYIVQERRLKRKDFTGLRDGPASLETLDRLSRQCVLIGFPIFTLAITTGAVLVASLGLLRTGSDIRAEYLFAVVSWFSYGTLIIARRTAGWQGRRAAWLTVSGFAAALLVLVGYFLRHLS